MATLRVTMPPGRVQNDGRWSSTGLRPRNPPYTIRRVKNVGGWNPPYALLFVWAWAIFDVLQNVYVLVGSPPVSASAAGGVGVAGG